MGGGFIVMEAKGREGREGRELPNSLVEKTISQSGGAGTEAAVPSPRSQEAV